MFACGMGLQFLEYRRQGVRETPDRARPEFLVLRSEVEIVDGARQMLWSFQLALHKRLIDDHLCGDVGEFTSLPRLYLLTHRFEVSLHPVNPTAMQSMSENDFECFASTGVKSPANPMSDPFAPVIPRIGVQP